MDQTTIFELNGNQSDPVYEELSKLRDITQVKIGPYTITKNQFGLYEIESKGIHDCASTLEKCYEYICTQPR
ncbi:hypothetical protein MUN89_21760 [Halobacillus salinarum]|uniref:Uncharacterized protein n=1 Tax=Halobacillus salinarum TaxID=2932257 RepID=A0ABY4EJ00_9BACI|nr:hypothetical protein [Halobacillus salinarum]UOQ44415.1 hypothetical protein MUN89_21760 [Halobacillus salinarum]